MARICCAVFAAITFTLSHAQVLERDAVERIVGAALVRGGAQSVLRHLTDSIGARVTGTPQSKQASAFLLGLLKAAGYDNARLEEYELKARWTRRQATGRIIRPIEQPLAVGSYGWVPGTGGEISARLVDLGAWTGNSIPIRFDGVRGAAVIVEPREREGTPLQVERAALAKAIAQSGAIAMLIPSDKPHRMLYTSAFCFYPKGPLPVISVANEDVLLLRRLLRLQPVQIALNVDNVLEEHPSTEVNVIADLPGSAPGEMILIGAHMDSWDWAPGAQDNGSGVAAIAEVARILKSLDFKPRRTIRFAFFSGEEQGLLGSRAYVERHREELDHLQAVLIMDAGAQAPRGIEIHGRTDIDSTLRTDLTNLSAVKADGISLHASFDTDHAPFLAAGIPALTLWVDDGEYDVLHHSLSDTYDKVDLGMLSLDVATMAIAAWDLAMAPRRVGRRLAADETEALLRRTGLESLRIALDNSGR